MSYAEKQLLEMDFYAHAIPYMASTRAVKERQIIEGGLVRVTLNDYNDEQLTKEQGPGEVDSGPRGPDSSLENLP